MTSCSPKKSTYLSLGFIVLLLTTGLIFLLFHFSIYRTFAIWFYLFGTSILTVALVLLLIKMIAGYRFCQFGNNTISIRFPLRGTEIILPIQDIILWEEDSITTNNRTFRQTTLVLPDKSSVRFSNHEHTNYTELLKYLHLKIPNKRPNSILKSKNKKK
jgi:hypothetical protein